MALYDKRKNSLKTTSDDMISVNLRKNMIESNQLQPWNYTLLPWYSHILQINIFAGTLQSPRQP